MGVAILFFIGFYPKRFKFFPAPLAVFIISTLIVYFFNLPIDTIFSHFGDITKSIDFTAHLPNLDIYLIGKLFQPALTIAILAGIESLLSVVVADGMISKKHRSDTELIAQGIANIGSAIFGGIPVQNVNNGGRTPIAGIAHAILYL